METKENKKFWVIKDPDGVLYLTSAHPTRTGCWDRFTYPALKRSGYEKAGWKPVKVYIKEDK